MVLPGLLKTLKLHAERLAILEEVNMESMWLEGSIFCDYTCISYNNPLRALTCIRAQFPSASRVHVYQRARVYSQSTIIGCVSTTSTTCLYSNSAVYQYAIDAL